MNEHTFFQKSIILKIIFLLIEITVVGRVNKDMKTQIYVMLSQFKHITVMTFGFHFNNTTSSDTTQVNFEP